MGGYKGGLKPALAAAALLVLLLSYTSPSEPVSGMYTDGLVLAAAWGPGSRLAVATTSGKVMVFDGQTGSPLWEARLGYIGDPPLLAWSPSGLLAVSLGESVAVLSPQGAVAWRLEWPPERGAASSSPGRVCGLRWLDGGRLAALVVRTQSYVERVEKGGGEVVVRYHYRYNVSLEVYGSGRLLWRRSLEAKEKYVSPAGCGLEYNGERLLAKTPTAVYLLDGKGALLWSRDVEGEARAAALSPTGYVAVGLEEGEAGSPRYSLLLYGPGGELKCSIRLRGPAEELAFTPIGDLVALSSSRLAVYGRACGEEWSKSFDESEPQSFSVGPRGEIALTIVGYADYDAFYGGGKSYYTFAPTGIVVYGSGGDELSRHKGFQSSWSSDGLLATWRRGHLYVYRGRSVLWDRAFLGRVGRVTAQEGRLCALVEPPARPVVLSPDGRALWSFTGDIRVSDAYLQQGYLVVTGYDSERSYFYIYDRDFREVLAYRSPSFKGGDYYEIVVPVVAVGGGGLAAAAAVDKAGVLRVTFYNLSGGGNWTVTLGGGLKPIRLEWMGDRLLYVADGEVGVVSADGGIAFRAELERDGGNDACPLAGDRVAVLNNGRAEIYTLAGERVWRDEFTTRLIACGEGILAKVSYSTLVVVDGEGRELWRTTAPHGDEITFIGWIGARLAVGTRRGELLLYDPQGRLLLEENVAPGINSVAAAGEDVLAVATDGGLYLVRAGRPGKAFLEVLLPSAAFSVSIDGESRRGPRVSVEVEPGRHSLRVDEEVEENGCVYRFQGWSDGAKSPERILDVEGNATLRALYSPARCLVSVSSRYGHVNGGGWYAYGAVAEVNVTDVAVDYGNGTRVVFEGWSTGEKSPSLEIRVEKGVELEALWRKQYLVTVKTPVGEAAGGGWYSPGDTAEIRLRETTVRAEGKEYVFKGWLVNGESAGASPTLRVRVDGPLTVEALWETRGAAGGGISPAYAALLALAVAAGAYIALKALKKGRKAGKS